MNLFHRYSQKDKNLKMESIYYNKVDNQIVFLFGYGIGNHLSVNFLKEYLKQIKSLLPQLSWRKLNSTKFLEVAQSSRRHRYMWYCRIDVDLTTQMTSTFDGHYFKLGEYSVYVIGDKPDETAQDCMNRMIHD